MRLSFFLTMLRVLSRLSAAPQLGARGLATGTTKFFNVTKGFGFITNDEDKVDVFVHQSAIKSDTFRTLDEGQRVSPRQRARRSSAVHAPCCAPRSPPPASRPPPAAAG